MKKSAFKIVSILFLCASLFSCREKIDSANIGLLVEQYGSDKGSPVTVASGAVWYNPWTQDVEELPGFVQHKEFEKISVSSSDGSILDMTPNLNYRVDRAKAAAMFIKYRKDLPDLEEQVMKTIVKESYRIILNQFTIDSIMGSRAKIEKMAFDTLFRKMEKEGFIVEQLTSGLTPPESITDAINAKNKAIQDAFKIENEVKSTEATAKKKVAEAEGNAQALRINADAEAYANKARQSSLTTLLVQQQYIEKWNGVLPVYGQVPTLFKSIQ